MAVPLKLTSRFSLLKIGARKDACNGCRACEKLCPMDIRIADYVTEGQRVLSTECTLCQTCTTVCSREALKLTLGMDVARDEKLRFRSERN